MFSKMFRNKSEANVPVVVDKELAGIESGPTGRLLRGLHGDITPRPEFARQLESRLRMFDQDKHTQVHGARRLLDRKAARPVLAVVGACLVLLAGVGFPLLSGEGARTASAAEVLNKASTASVTVPEGKVRHIVTSFMSKQRDGSEITSTAETWLSQVNGRAVSRMSGMEGESLVVNDGETVWFYLPKSNVVNKMPSPLEDMAQINDTEIILNMLKMPNTRVVEQTTLDGRNVTVVESTGAYGEDVPVTHPDSVSDGEPRSVGVAIDIPLAGPALPPGASLYFRVWVETDSGQILKQEFGFKQASGEVTIQATIKLVLDETRDRSEFPPDLFTFKVPEGAQVLDFPEHPEILRSDTPGNEEEPLP